MGWDQDERFSALCSPFNVYGRFGTHYRCCGLDILTGNDLIDTFHEYVRSYPGRGYGGMFGTWARTRSREPYNSYGNGSAMRVSPVGFAFETIEEVLHNAELTAAVTRNHPEGLREEISRQG